MDINGIGMAYSDYMADASKNNKATSLKDRLDKGSTDVTEDELMATCKEFESYFLEQVFKSMLETTKVFSDEENSYASKMVDFHKDSAVQQLTKQASEKSGLGIANILYEQMKRNYGL